MPLPEEVCEVTALGMRYRNWKWIEYERKHPTAVTHLRMRVMEITPPNQPRADWSNLKLKPWDAPVTATLAGRTVFTDGFVSVRQGIITPTNHEIEIIVASKTADLAVSTPIHAVGQYDNATFWQIANAVSKPYGVAVVPKGDLPDEVNKPFERFQIQWGETALQVIDRAARFRNLHLVDDASKGTLEAGRAMTGAPAATLVEGGDQGNIKEAHAVMSIEEAVGPVWNTGQNYGTDNHWGDTARAMKTLADRFTPRYRPFMLIAEQPVDLDDLRMRNDREAADFIGTEVTAYITVRGWLDPATGALWCEYLYRPIKILCPDVFPVPEVTLWVRGVKHRQSNEEGAISIIECCLAQGIGGYGFLPEGLQPPDYKPAVPEGSDDQ